MVYTIYSSIQIQFYRTVKLFVFDLHILEKVDKEQRHLLYFLLVYSSLFLG